MRIVHARRYEVPAQKADGEGPRVVEIACNVFMKSVSWEV
jgi:hypothetical protein